MPKKQGKRKMSIDFTDTTYELLDEYANETGESKSAIVNNFITMLLDVPDAMKENLVHLFREEAKAWASDGLRGAQFAAAEYDKALRIRQMYIDLFSRGAYPMSVTPMKKVPVIDGFAFVPEDWIVIENIPFEKRKYVFVVEVLHGERFKLPHFLYFSEEENVGTAFTRNIETLCAELYPKINEVKRLAVTPLYVPGKGVLNAEDYLDSPKIGHFLIADHGSSSTYPFGAMVFRESAKDGTASAASCNTIADEEV